MKGLFKFNVMLVAVLLILGLLFSGCNVQNIGSKKISCPGHAKFRAQSLKKIYAAELKELNRVGRIAVIEPEKVDQFKKQLLT